MTKNKCTSTLGHPLLGRVSLLATLELLKKLKVISNSDLPDCYEIQAFSRTIINFDLSRDFELSEHIVYVY